MTNHELAIQLIVLLITILSLIISILHHVWQRDEIGRLHIKMAAHFSGEL